jgi:hypothetical protein
MFGPTGRPRVRRAPRPRLANPPRSSGAGPLVAEHSRCDGQSSGAARRSRSSRTPAPASRRRSRPPRARARDVRNDDRVRDLLTRADSGFRGAPAVRSPAPVAVQRTTDRPRRARIVERRAPDPAWRTATSTAICVAPGAARCRGGSVRCSRGGAEVTINASDQDEPEHRPVEREIAREHEDDSRAARRHGASRLTLTMRVRARPA